MVQQKLQDIFYSQRRIRPLHKLEFTPLIILWIIIGSLIHFISLTDPRVHHWLKRTLQLCRSPILVNFRQWKQRLKHSQFVNFTYIRNKIPRRSILKLYDVFRQELMYRPSFHHLSGGTPYLSHDIFQDFWRTCFLFPDISPSRRLVQKRRLPNPSCFTVQWSGGGRLAFVHGKPEVKQLRVFGKAV